MRLHLSGVGALVSATLIAIAAVTLAAAQQHSTDSTDATVSGCLQRAPSTMAKDGRFMLMNASISPLGGSGVQDTAPPSATPPQPARGEEPVQHHTGESDARQETGGVSYLLQGGSDLEQKIGQRIEVTGTIGGELRQPPTRLSAAQPLPTLRIKRVRAIAPAC